MLSTLFPKKSILRGFSSPIGHISIIPPLNYYGAETELYEDINDNFEIALDTGLVINDLKNKVSHIALCDNTPYTSKSSEIIKKILPKNKKANKKRRFFFIAYKLSKNFMSRNS